MPTLAGLAGVVLRNEKPLDGVDLAILLSGGPAKQAAATAIGDRAIVASFGGGGTVTGTIAPGWDPPLNTSDDRIPRGHGESFSKEFKPLTLGTIALEKGPTMLVLRATAIPGGSVADVRRLVLRPAL